MVLHSDQSNRALAESFWEEFKALPRRRIWSRYQALERYRHHRDLALASAHRLPSIGHLVKLGSHPE